MNRKFIVPPGREEALQSIGLAAVKAGAYFDTERHFIHREGLPEWILLYCDEGSGFFEGEKRRTVGAGQAVLLPAGQAHTYGSLAKDPWKLYWVHFLWEQNRILLPELSQLGKGGLFSAVEAEKIRLVFSLLLESLTGESGGARMQIECAGYLLSLLSLLKKEERQQPRCSGPIRQAVTVLKNSLCRELTLDDLAMEVGISKYHLLRSFKESIGVPPMHYLSDLRVQEACRLLVTETLSIEEISDRLCFHNSKYFSEVFREKTGLPPGKFRRTYSEFLIL